MPAPAPAPLPWAGALAASVIGLALFAWGRALALPLVLGGLALLLFRAGRASPRRALPIAATALATAALTAVTAVPLAWRVAGAAMAAAGLLAALTPAGHPRRRLVPLLGHATVALGAVLVVVSQAAITTAGSLVLAAGFALLLLHAHWAQRGSGPQPATLKEWEPLLLASIVAGLGAMTLIYTGGLDAFPRARAWEPAAITIALGAGIIAFSTLCKPPRAPALLRSKGGVLLDTLAQGLAAIALVNILFLGLSLVSGWSLRVIFGALFAWQILVVAIEVRTLRHAHRRLRGAIQPPSPARQLETITIVVCARDEAAVLPETLAHNLALRHPARFILVPATTSADDTVSVAERSAQAHPHRVRVVHGDTGSKAEDLNKAWRSIETDLVLLLDADETIDDASVARAVDIMRADPDVGVVQGRKVSRAADDGWLARFISAERRYCTWMDHVMHGEDLGSGHFGGSAALVRREVPNAVGGWTEQTLTEDIEFTLRVHLHARWRIVYAPEVIVGEADPIDLRQLLRQRTRWARGWAQCFRLYFPDIIRARGRLGRKRTFGLALLLLIAVSALWTTLVPATLLLRLSGISPILPLVVAVPLTLLLLPGRFLVYGYAALRDPVIPITRTPGRIAQLALQAYLWILLGWFVQLHALYLELSSAPRAWDVTAKRSTRAQGTALR